MDTKHLRNWDTIVLGLGGVGSSAAYHLAKLGQRVLGIDQYPPAHNRGSSHGQTRAIRQAYFEDPAYVPLLRRAYELWDELESKSNRKLFHRTSIVQIGPADGFVVPGVLRSANEHGLTVEQLAMQEVTARWPVMQGNADWQAVIESNAGFLRVEACVATHLELARKHGAELRHGQSVINWESKPDAISVQTESGTERANHLIIAAGAWAAQLLTDQHVPLQVLRKQQYWFPTRDTSFQLEAGFPCFFYETPADFFYGFPQLDDGGMKVARHSGGIPISTPSDSDDTDEVDLNLVQEFIAAYLPALEAKPSHRSGCYYTVTPDEHFVIDTLPQDERVVVIAGLSGHGFKFTSVLGELAAKLTVETDVMSEKLFRMDRFDSPRK